MNGFYRGMMFPLCTSGALNSILFGLYGNELRRLQNSSDSDEKKEKWRQHVFISGSFAGLIHSFIACPLELIKIRLQTQNCKTFCFLPNDSLLCTYTILHTLFLHTFLLLLQFIVLSIYILYILFPCLLLPQTNQLPNENNNNNTKHISYQRLHGGLIQTSLITNAARHVARYSASSASIIQLVSWVSIVVWCQ